MALVPLLWLVPTYLKKAHREYYTKIYNDVLGAENLWKNIFLFDTYCKSIGQKYVSIIAKQNVVNNEFYNKDF